jgi:PAS domain S-box-containing protein
MFFKEEEILSSMLADTLGAEEWADIQEQSADFGDIFSVRPVAPAKTGRAAGPPTTSPGDSLALDTGQLTPGQINAILTNLPLDITFVDSNDQVKYFSQGKERIFTRTKSIIGRKVQNCHPPESVHMVEKIVNDFKTGRHSGANFWLELNGRFIHIQYTALRDESGQYLGTMEVSQDITPLRNLEGERRLLQYSH